MSDKALTRWAFAALVLWFINGVLALVNIILEPRERIASVQATPRWLTGNVVSVSAGNAKIEWAEIEAGETYVQAVRAGTLRVGDTVYIHYLDQFHWKLYTVNP